MISNRPYLLRAFHQWIVDSQCTPILVIDANNPRCKIPMDYAEGGEIVFNISASAVRDLKMTNDLVEFKASFSGVVHIVSAPVKAILAVYAEENGEGIFFDADEDDADDDGILTDEIMPLRRIDGGLDGVVMEASDRELLQSQAKAKPFLKLVE